MYIACALGTHMHVNNIDASYTWRVPLISCSQGAQCEVHTHVQTTETCAMETTETKWMEDEKLYLYNTKLRDCLIRYKKVLNKIVAVLGIAGKLLYTFSHLPSSPSS